MEKSAEIQNLLRQQEIYSQNPQAYEEKEHILQQLRDEELSEEELEHQEFEKAILKEEYRIDEIKETSSESDNSLPF